MTRTDLSPAITQGRVFSEKIAVQLHVVSFYKELSKKLLVRNNSTFTWNQSKSKPRNRIDWPKKPPKPTTNGAAIQFPFPVWFQVNVVNIPADRQSRSDRSKTQVNLEYLRGVRSGAGGAIVGRPFFAANPVIIFALFVMRRITPCHLRFCRCCARNLAVQINEHVSEAVVSRQTHLLIIEGEVMWSMCVTSWNGRINTLFTTVDNRQHF